MKYFDTFTGIGGFTKAIQDIIPEAQCVGFSEIDKYAIQIYQKHYPNHKNYGDITKINTDTLPNFDLLVGGFPCQAFSIAGKRRGFEDTRGTLFFDLARILQAKKPRYFIFENVKGLLSHDNGQTFKTIIKTLDELGYSVEWQVLNSKNHGVPQNRERVYIVGHLGGISGQQVFPIFGQTETVIGQSKACIAMDGKRSTAAITDTFRTLSSSFRGHPDGDGRSAVIAKTGINVNLGELQPRIDSTCLDASYYKGLDNHGGRTGVYENHTIRRLTPTECERLQAFPDGWTEGVSDSQRYKCLGNAVTVNVVKEIIKNLKARNK